MFRYYSNFFRELLSAIQCHSQSRYDVENSWVTLFSIKTIKPMMQLNISFAYYEISDEKRLLCPLIDLEPSLPRQKSMNSKT